MWRRRSRSCVAEASAAAFGAARVEQALALVDAEGLGVHAGQLGRHRDDVHALGYRWRSSVIVTLHRRPRAGGSSTLARASTAARWSSVSLSGTATSTVTSRSPVGAALAGGNPPALDPEGAARRGAGGHPQGDRVGEGRDGEGGAQGRLGG